MDSKTKAINNLLKITQRIERKCIAGSPISEEFMTGQAEQVSEIFAELDIRGEDANLLASRIGFRAIYRDRIVATVDALIDDEIEAQLGDILPTRVAA